MLQPLDEQSQAQKVAVLEALEKKVLWLSSWLIHHANHVRPNPGGLKVGGHQASSASLTTVMTALYFDVLRPEDRIAVKPHASPVFHAIQYLLGSQTREQLENFRAMGGAQSYPSRTKDSDDVDFSTGSVGLGVAMTTFASLVQDYLSAKSLLPRHAGPGRMVALAGDAELDEGNVFEAMLEGWKHDVHNVWWVVDYNRQSLDAVVTDRLFTRINQLFETMGWRVVTLKYGKRLQAAFDASDDGPALQRWIDECPNSLYSALVFKGGSAWRERLLSDLGHLQGIRTLLQDHDDEALGQLMTDLGGHCMRSVLNAFEEVADERPTCIVAYTIKGHGLPLAGHKDNHAGLMTPEQMETLRREHKIAQGDEWAPFAGSAVPEETLRKFISNVKFASSQNRRHRAALIEVGEPLQSPRAEQMSTQECFGRLMASIARSNTQLADRIVTASPDVTVSTSLGGWVNRRKVFDRDLKEDTFKSQKISSFQQWTAAPDGQHIELGIAENNLFILLAALGLSHSLFGTRLLPIGTLYDPFIQRGLDALNYACYQDARFILVATPSGLSLAPEGGAHQSISTPLIGMGQDGLTSFEPAYADELAAILHWSFGYLQRESKVADADDLLGDMHGGSVYLRLSTRAIAQPTRELNTGLRNDIIKGGYWASAPSDATRFVIAYCGAVAPEAQAALDAIIEDLPDTALLAITSADRLFKGWHTATGARREGYPQALSHIESILSNLPLEASIITVHDGHPATLSWLGSVNGHRVRSLGVDHFGQSGDLSELYREYRIDTQAIIDACAAAYLGH